jgi:hypothetical protein
LIEFAVMIQQLTLPTMKSEAGKAVASDIQAKNLNFARWITTKADKL